MKILFVNQTGNFGGGELSLLDIIKGLPFQSEAVLFSDGPLRDALQQLDIPVHILPLSQSLANIKREFEVLPVLRVLPAAVSLIWRLKRHAEGVDILYANSQKAMMLSAIVAFWTGKPLIWHLRDLLNADHFSGFLRKSAVTVANRFCACVIANSEATREAFIAIGGDPKQVRVVYNGFDPVPFDAITEAKITALRQTLGSGPLFGVFGRLSPWKGQHVLLEALTLLPEGRAVIVGDALFGEDDYAKQLRDQVQRLGIDERVDFLGFRHDIPLLMKAMDVVVHTSTSAEPFGRVVVEGMLAGKPVVATNAGGVKEIIDDGETGLLTPCGDSGALARALLQLKSDLTLARKVVANGGKMARERFTIQNLVADISAVIQEIAREY